LVECWLPLSREERGEADGAHHTAACRDFADQLVRDVTSIVVYRTGVGM
jgi:hypothetical protein